jgi:hypothetical protein
VPEATAADDRASMKRQTPCVAALLMSVMILTCAQALDLHTVRSLRLCLVLNSAAALLVWQQLIGIPPFGECSDWVHGGLVATG